MTKKHFEEMAAYVRASRASAKSGDAESDTFLRGMYHMAAHLGHTFGKRFDVERFRAACEVTK